MAASSISALGAMGFLTDLNLTDLVATDDFKNLVSLLSQSDSDGTEMNIFRNENEVVAAKNFLQYEDVIKSANIPVQEAVKNYKVFRRDTPFISGRLPSSAPSWARGAKPSVSLGPFTNKDGRNQWYDFYSYEKMITVYINGDAAPAMLLPLKLTLVQIDRRTAFTIGDGSIWLRADMFAGGLTNKSYAGLNISGGSIDFSEAHDIVNDTITINAAETIGISLTLNNAFTVNGSGVQGIDARESVVTLPATVNIAYGNYKFSFTQIAAASWKLYGDERNFYYQNAAADYNVFLKRLNIPLTTDKAIFEVASCKSEFFYIEGAAKVTNAGWCLSVAEMDVTKPFAVNGNGALGILADKGLQYHWKGLPSTYGDVKMNFPLILAEPGKFSVNDVFSLFKQHTEEYKLWRQNTGSKLRTAASLAFKKDKIFIYYADQTGNEAVTAFADVNFETDKPYRADGKPVSPKTVDSIYVKYITATLNSMFVYDADMHLEATPAFNHLDKPEIYQFAITNAYMVTTPPASVLLAGDYDKHNILTKGNLNIVFGLFSLIPTLPHPYTANQNLQDFGVDINALKNVQDVSAWLPLLTNDVMSTCTWDDKNKKAAGVITDFILLTDFFRALKQQPTGAQVIQQEIQQTLQLEINEQLSLIRGGIEGNDIYGYNLFSMLDLSTNYDLFGVNMVWNNTRYMATNVGLPVTISSGVVTIKNMNLQTPMALLNSFTLPHISWEPVNNLAETSEPDYPPLGVLSFRDSGPPTIFTQFDPKFIDIDPLKYLQRFKANVSANVKNPYSYIIFGLPNGKVSFAVIKYFDPKYATVNKNLDFVQPEFTQQGNTLKGGIQFRVAASTQNQNRPMIPGVTNQLRNLRHFGGDITPSILGGLVHEIFLNDFYHDAGGNIQMKPDGVPVTHIDFSGYGASTFSDWRNPQARIAQVSQAKFDVMIGRAAHEVVQVVSILYPWGIRVVRTITLYRNDNAVVYREDSGWVAQSDGVFDFYFKLTDDGSQFIQNPFSIHPGVVNGLFNVHNITEVKEPHIEFDYQIQPGEYFFDTDKVVKPSSGVQTIHAEFAAVTFDADVAIDNIISGATNNRVSGKSFKGYLQVLPQAVPINAGALKQIFDRQQNSIGGTVDCTMKIAASEQRTKLNRIDVAASYQNDNKSDYIFVVNAKGSIQLPAEGSWSIVQVDKSSGDVVNVINKQSVPVIRAGERDRNNSAFSIPAKDNIVKVAPADSLKNTFFPGRFGYVQNTGTQKLLLTDPRFDETDNAELRSDTALLADSYRLLNSKGPFPNIQNAIAIEAAAESRLKAIEQGLQKTVNNFTMPADVKFDIIGKDGDVLHMFIEYESSPTAGGTPPTVVNYVTDSLANPAEKWKNELSNMSLAVDLGPFKKLMTISGDFKTKNSVDPDFDSGNAPQLKLCPELEPIYDILEFLASLDPTNPVDAIKKGLKIAMSNVADSWEYKFVASKEIPVVKFPFDPIDYNAPTTPLKLDAYFKMGCYFNQPITIPNSIDQLTPSAGAFLELGADLRVMCFSLAAATIYATGRAEVGLAADVKSGPSLYFKFGFGVELCVGLPVIGDVSVMYLVGVDMQLTTKELTVGAFIYFRGRVEIFGGMVTVTIAIEAAGKIQKELGGGPTNCIAMCTFALDISIFWVIDINFSETWEETRQIA